MSFKYLKKNNVKEIKEIEHKIVKIRHKDPTSNKLYFLSSTTVEVDKYFKTIKADYKRWNEEDKGKEISYFKIFKTYGVDNVEYEILKTVANKHKGRINTYIKEYREEDPDNCVNGRDYTKLKEVNTENDDDENDMLYRFVKLKRDNLIYFTTIKPKNTNEAFIRNEHMRYENGKSNDYYRSLFKKGIDKVKIECLDKSKLKDELNKNTSKHIRKGEICLNDDDELKKYINGIYEDSSDLDEIYTDSDEEKETKKIEKGKAKESISDSDDD